VPEAAYDWPALTTVRQDFAELGTRAVGLAVSALRDAEPPSSDLVRPELVVRASSSAPPTP